VNSGGVTSHPVEAGILSTLKYFGLFRFPLLPEEIHRFHPLKCTKTGIETSLEAMTAAGSVHRSAEGFYSIDELPGWSAERNIGTQKAHRLLSRSGQFTRIISRFPFVRAVAISGSLSKYYAGEDADIDYFIITGANRLWIARSLLHLFKKLTFLTGHQHFFCMNYFIDTEALETTDTNLYTAIELVTLIPVYHHELIARLKAVNAWTGGYLPNATREQDVAYLQQDGKMPIKKLAEWLLNHLWPGALNRFLMQFTDRKWRRKWQRKGFPMDDYEEAFFTSLHVSKNHPANFRKRVLQALECDTELAGSNP
jgi:hypothetical protein